MDKHFLPYFAGYIDGDGHFRFKTFRQDGYICHTCKIMITSTNTEPLEYFIKNIGGAYYKKTNKKINWKDEFIYTLHIGKDKFNQLKELGKFLIEKQPQFFLIENFIYGTKEERERIIEQAKEFRNTFGITKEIVEKLKHSKNTVKPKAQDFIYLAGYIDSECCLTVTKKILKPTNSLSFSCHLRCGTTKYPSIEFIYKRFGGCISCKKTYKEKWSTAIEIQITDKSLEKILPKIENHLINKKVHCEKIIQLRDTYKNVVPPRHKNFSIYYSQVTPIRLSIYNALKTINKRGI